MRTRTVARLLALAAIAIPIPFAACGDRSSLRAKQIESSFELVGGPVAMANVGDFLLENDQIRVAILGAHHSPGPGVFGGSLVDADLRRPDQRFADGQGRDRFAETFPIANLLVPDPGSTEVTVVNDGEAGSEAVIRVEGEGAFMFDALTVLRRQSDLLSLLFKDLKPSMRFRTDYILRPGDRFVTLRTTLTLPSAPDGCPDESSCDPPLSLDNYTGPSDIFLGILGDDNPVGSQLKGGVVAGDFVFFGNQSDIFGPGMGFDEEKTVFDAIFARRDTFKEPLSFDFVAASGGDVSYGYFSAPAAGAPPSKVNVPVFTSAATAFLSAGKSCLADASDDAACDAKTSFTYERYFAVGAGDIASVAETFYKVRGAPLGTVKGNVVWEGTGQPAPNARVFLFRDPGAGAALTSVDALAEANVRASGDVGLLNEIDADLGLDPVEDGDFSAGVAPGDYVLVARDQGDTATTPPARIHVEAGEAVEIIPALPPPARVRYRVTDESGDRAPAKLTFIALDEAGEPYERDGLRRVYMGEPRLGNGILAIEYSASGEGEIAIEPGRYRLLVTRGIEYGRQEEHDFVLASGDVKKVDAVVVHEVDTSGWMSIDMHLHSQPSFDSGMPLDRRVTTAAAEGLDVAVATDHDVHTDYEPSVRKLGLAEVLKTAVGAEVSTLDLGHFIGWPLKYDEREVPDHGVFDWVCKSGSEVTAGIRATGVTEDKPVTLLAHPRDGAIGYISQLGVDQFTMNRPKPDSNVLLRTAACDFDAMEVFNAKRLDLIRTPTIAEVVDFNRCLKRIDDAKDEAGLGGACPELGQGKLAPCKPGERYSVCQHRNRTALAWGITKRILTRTEEEQNEHWDFPMTSAEGEPLCLVGQFGDAPVPAAAANLPCTHHPGHVDDMFRYLEHGFRPTQVGSSDGHGPSLEPGTPRTYFRSPTDVPGELRLSDATASIRGGHAFATYGPFIAASIGGRTFGETASAKPGKTAELDLRVETASWFGVDRVEIYVSGRLAQVLKPSKGPQALIDVDEKVLLKVPEHDAWVVVIAMGLRDENLMSPVDLDVPFGELQLPRVASLAFTQVEALASFFPPSPPIPDWFPVPPYAVSNPIFIDTDGDGAYDAPLGDGTGLAPFCSRPCDPAVFDPNQCPPSQKCLDPEGSCGYFLNGTCEGESAMSAMIPDGH